MPPSEQQENTQNRAPETDPTAPVPPMAAGVVRAADGVLPGDAERDVVRASDDAAGAPAAAAASDAALAAPEVAAPPDR